MQPSQSRSSAEASATLRAAATRVATVKRRKRRGIGHLHPAATRVATLKRRSAEARTTLRAATRVVGRPATQRAPRGTRHQRDVPRELGV